jgi:D-alanyl-D-alanine carboxypeptidase
MIFSHLMITGVLAVIAFSSCAKQQRVAENVAIIGNPAMNGIIEPDKAAYQSKLSRVLAASAIPPNLADRIQAEEAVFMPDLLAVFEEGDPWLRRLVDKTHPLDPLQYVPSDLVELSRDGAWTIAREGMLLRYPAAAALQEMALAARGEGLTLLASSTYRSYDYQVEVYGRNVRQSGQATADRESARPGYSQHQTGLVVDFGSISDDYAKTPAGKWLYANASRYGWSLSFPDGYEAVTGYRWECWHYRYAGKALSRFIDTWFGTIQQYALQFIHEWESDDDAFDIPLDK